MQTILKETYEVTNEFNKETTLVGITSLLNCAIFQNLIKNEKDKLVLTITLEVNE